METLITEEEMEREMESYIPEIHALINDVAFQRAEKILHRERYKEILRKQQKRARIRNIVKGVTAMLGCFFIPVILGTIFAVPELATTELLFVPLGIYFMWESL